MGNINRYHLSDNNLYLFTQYIPHGHCYLWQTPLVWLHITADSSIALAYYSIPVILFCFFRQQQNSFLKEILVLFSLFIFSCGTTHLMSIWTLWHPDYWIAGFVKAVTALISVYTAIKLIEFFPMCLNLPNPATLEKTNQQLAQQVEEKKKVEIELKKERLFLKTLLDSLSDGVVACDEKGILALFNPASQEIFGTQQPLNSKQWSRHYNLYHSDGETYLEEEELPLYRAFQGETFNDVELVTIDQSNKLRVLIANGSPILDPQGDKLGAVVILRDVTQRKQKEKQLKDSNTELLLSNQELEQFAYVASHDLREPLRMVTSFTQLLSQRYANQLDSEADKIIAFAVDGAKRMETLIEDLLLYSRVGKDNRTLKIVDCNLVVEKALSNLQMLIEESNATIEVKPLPKVVGDEIRLIQLFQNLINNALTYLNSDRPRIEITATSQQQGWLFSVKDNGIGIAAQNHRRIFEVFQRLHPKEKYSGTGIGLAICKKIVERHGGTIWVESQLGAGADFKFTLNAPSFAKI